ncbi:MAG TPA: ankyrin repeat domain-containing protein [Candidatus Ozemobacteraceae bacterium]|nr:ankyrin repeat domain-containing protein [Candidatus Ozemobacteraceae bacterium]
MKKIPCFLALVAFSAMLPLSLFSADLTLIAAPNGRAGILASATSGIRSQYLAETLRLSEIRANDFPLRMTTPRSGEGDIFGIGEEFSIRCDLPADVSYHINLFSLGTRGNLVRLFPNKWAPDSLVSGSSSVVIPPPKARFALRTSEPPGTDLILAIAIRGDDATMSQQKTRAAGPFALFDDLASAATVISDWTRAEKGKQVSVRHLAIHTRGAEPGDGAFSVGRSGDWVARLWIDQSRLQAGQPVFLKVLSNKSATISTVSFKPTNGSPSSIIPNDSSIDCNDHELLVLPRAEDSWAWQAQGPSGDGVLQLVLAGGDAASITLDLPLSIEGEFLPPASPAVSSVTAPMTASATPITVTATASVPATTSDQMSSTGATTPTQPPVLVTASTTQTPSTESTTPDIATPSSSETVVTAPATEDLPRPVPASRTVSISAFLAAARQGKVRDVQALLQRFPWLVEARGERRATALHWAASEGHAEIVSLLASAGAWVNAPADGDMRPLHLAAWHGHTETVRRLIAAGAGVNPVNRFHETPLLLAVKERRRETVQELLRHGALPEIADNNGSTALNWAGVNQDTALIASLEAAGCRTSAARTLPLVHTHAAAGNLEAVKADLASEAASLHAVDQRGRTPLHIAAEHRFAEIVKYLLTAGARVDAVDFSGRTALHLACQRADQLIVSQLLEAGASLTTPDADQRTPIHLLCLSDVDESDLLTLLKLIPIANQAFRARDVDGCLPIHLAVQKRQRSVYSYLCAIDLPAELRKTGEGLSCLGLAVRHAESDTIDAFIPSTADLNSRELGRSFTLPLVAAEAGNTGMLRALLERTFSQSPALDGTTLLHAAARSGNAEAVSIALRHHPMLEAVDVEGNTPLHLATSLAHADTAALLIASGASVQTANGDGMTALHLAALSGSTDVLAAVLKKGVSVQTPTSTGDLALHLAAEAGNTEIVERLLAAGARRDTRDARGQTAAGRARAAGFDDIADYLERETRP